MDNERDMKNVVSSFMHAWLFAVVAYCHLGVVIGRPTSYRQNYIMPLLFTLFPALYFCQISLNLSLLRRQYQSRTASDRMESEEERWFYTACALDMHCIQYYDHQPSACSLKLSLMTPPHVSRCNKCKTGAFSRVLFVTRILILLLGVYQAIAASIIYGQRATLLYNGNLVLYHLTSIYAICGTGVMVATLFIMIQPYEWRIGDIGNRRDAGDSLAIPLQFYDVAFGNENDDMEDWDPDGSNLELQEWMISGFVSDLDNTYCPVMHTSNAWMFDASNAIIIHSVIFLILLFSRAGSLIQNSTIISLLTWLYRLLIVLIPFILFGAPALQTTCRQQSDCGTTSWGGDHLGNKWKSVAAAVGLETIICLGVWVLAVVEAKLVTSSRFNEVKAWKAVNPGFNQFHHVFWSIWT